jgi:hypothetical protein
MPTRLLLSGNRTNMGITARLSRGDCAWRLSAMMEENTKIPEIQAYFLGQTTCSKWTRASSALREIVRELCCDMRTRRPSAWRNCT